MRPILLSTLFAIAATGCQPSALTLTHMSTLDSQTRGVVLYDDGQRGHAAMWETTCEFDTLNGWLISDHDLPTQDEVIQDTFDGQVIGRSDQGAHIVQDRGRDVVQTGVVASRLLERGVVTVYDKGGDCRVSFREGPAVSVPDEACDLSNGFDTDREGRVFIGTATGTLSVDAEGSTEIDGPNDFVVYDRATGLTYVARHGGTEVRALTKHGDIRWSYETDGGITAMDDMGRRGMVMVMTAVAGSSGGEIIILEGHSGERVTEHSTPSSEVDLTVSEDGTTMAAVLKDQVFFYDVTDEDDAPKVRKTLGQEQPTFID